jgi:adenosylmethionine-8-amino-7-oxononanoate aminotransferase
VAVALKAREHGVIVRPLGDVVVLMPPFCITDEEMDLLVDGVHAAIREVTGC